MEDSDSRATYESDSIDEVFSCDCNTHDHCLNVELSAGGHLAVFTALNQRWFNRPWYECLAGGLVAFWDVFWHHQQSVEIVLNRQEHRKFKLFFKKLADERCWNCDPYFPDIEHSHGRKR